MAAWAATASPQTQAQIFTRYRFGTGLAEALDAPRWLLGRTWGQESTTLKLENRFDPDLVAGLRRLGQEVEVLDEPYSDVLGSCRHARAISCIRRRANRSGP